MDDLITWLRAQLDEDERAARAWMPFGTPTAADREHIARHDPARVLAEVDAKRRILDECESAIRKSAPRSNLNDLGWTVLRPLALPYADRPGYRDEWRP